MKSKLTILFIWISAVFIANHLSLELNACTVKIFNQNNFPFLLQWQHILWLCIFGTKSRQPVTHMRSQQLQTKVIQLILSG